MLVEHYPTDKRFEELLRYFPELSRELKKINAYLEDEQLYRLIGDNLAKRYPKTRETGRHSTPVEVVLRMQREMRVQSSMEVFFQVWYSPTICFNWYWQEQNHSENKPNRRKTHLALTRRKL